MKKHTNTTTPSPQTQEQALKIARATQRPGQTKEQTKLIAQGIQKGIEQYKKQQKAKARELDKNLKKVRRQLQQADDTRQETSERPADIVVKQSKLAWILLILSWLCFAAYVFFIA